MTWVDGRGRLFVLAILAALGGALLAVAIATFWMDPGDALAYWIAGERLMDGVPIYSTGEAAFAPYAYHYTPPLAQVLAPLTYLVGFRVLLMLVTWDLAA